VRHIADEVAVMQQGKFVERGSVGDIFQRPEHPYTRALLAAMLKPEARRPKASSL
jgi:ABC-type dipeptide/oligopeptide/nickel transport system ATPase component